MGDNLRKEIRFQFLSKTHVVSIYSQINKLSIPEFGSKKCEGTTFTSRFLDSGDSGSSRLWRVENGALADTAVTLHLKTAETEKVD